jgi:hypothetical protein
MAKPLQGHLFTTLEGSAKFLELYFGFAVSVPSRAKKELTTFQSVEVSPTATVAERLTVSHVRNWPEAAQANTRGNVGY